MTTALTLWLLAVPFAQKAPNPADVKPGWLGLGVFLLLAAATVLLWLNFRKQLRKINFVEQDPPSRREVTEASSGTDGADEPEQR